MTGVPILLAAFGTTVPEAQETYRRFGAAVIDRFPDNPVRWAYTAGRVRAKLAAENRSVPSPAEALSDLAAAGVRRVVVQSMHIMPGQMDAELRRLSVQDVFVGFGLPLLASDADGEAVALALRAELRPDRLNVVAAHGNARHAEYNEPILDLARRLTDGRDNVVVASVEGEPGADDLEAHRGRAEALGGVHVLPLMLVAGDHVRNDILGDEPDAWVRRLDAKEVTCAPPLGDLPAVREVFFSHIAAALDAVARETP